MPTQPQETFFRDFGQRTRILYYKNCAIWTFKKYCENKIYLENRWKRDFCDFIIEKKFGLGKYLELLEL